MNMNTENLGIESKVHVKSGDLAAKGKGKIAITYAPGGQYRVGISLPDAAGVCQSLDLTSIERVELVKTKIGWFGRGGLGKALTFTTVAIVAVPILFPHHLLIPFIPYPYYSQLFNQIYIGTLLSGSYASGVYTGTKLMRAAQLILTTQDGKHAVIEGPESVFRFISGIYAAPNIQLETVESGTPIGPSEDPQPASA